MYMTMTMMRPGLFFQREGPRSEPGNSLVCPDEAACSVCGVLGMNQCRASLLHKQHKQMIYDRRWGGRCRDEPHLCMQMSMRVRCT